MRKVKAQKMSGWAAGIVSIATIALVIPMIGSKASDQRSNAAWLDAAHDFRLHMSQISPAETADIERFQDTRSLRALSNIRIEHLRWSANRASEHQCLSEAIYYEARSESRSGQLAVADVVKNRVSSKHYPNSICGVVYENADRPYACQFSFACDGSMDQAPIGEAWERSKKMAQISLSGQVFDLTQNSTHYHTVNVDPDWAKTLELKKQVGFHLFYRPSWRERNTQTAAIAVAPPT